MKQASRRSMLFLSLTLVALAASACGDPSLGGLRADGPQLKQPVAKVQEGDPSLRKIEVYDIASNDSSFDVRVDDVLLGTTQPDDIGEWQVALTPGQHMLRLTRVKSSSNLESKVWIKLYSGMNQPIYYPELQTASARCGFYFSESNGRDLVQMGRQNAECTIYQGESITLKLEVPASH